MRTQHLDTSQAMKVTDTMNALRPLTRGVQKMTKILTGLIMAMALIAAETTLTAAGPSSVFLGEAAHFTILAGAAITTTGGGLISGDVGAYPIAGSAIGIPPVQVNGTIYARDATGTQATNVVIDADLLLRAKNDMHTAWVDADRKSVV